MCGRYASFREAQDLADHFDISDVDVDVEALPPSWNIAPTQTIRILTQRIVDDIPVRSLRLARWGLVPPWATDPSIGSRLINARSETLAEKASFKRALCTRRCGIPAEGYYEWHTPTSPHGKPGHKSAYYVALDDDAPAMFAGLYEFWRDPLRGDQDPRRWLASATIITGAAQEDLASLHERRPIALDHDALAHWLDPGLTDAGEALSVLARPSPHFAARRVSDAVNSVRNDGPDLLTYAE